MTDQSRRCPTCKHLCQLCQADAKPTTKDEPYRPWWLGHELILCARCEDAMVHLNEAAFGVRR